VAFFSVKTKEITSGCTLGYSNLVPRVFSLEISREKALGTRLWAIANYENYREQCNLVPRVSHLTIT